jgi:hypothetical protein
MCPPCNDLAIMAIIRIHNIPVDLYRGVKSRAELTGMYVPDFALSELRRSLERPTREELLTSLAGGPGRTLVQSPTELIREERDLRAGD